MAVWGPASGVAWTEGWTLSREVGGELGEAWLHLGFTRFALAAAWSPNRRGEAGGGETRRDTGVLSAHQRRADGQGLGQT